MDTHNIDQAIREFESVVGPWFRREIEGRKVVDNKLPHPLPLTTGAQRQHLLGGPSA